jgi:hypothetical protein
MSHFHGTWTVQRPPQDQTSQATATIREARERSLDSALCLRALDEATAIPHLKSVYDWRRQMIAEAAYFRAEKRGFQGGDPVTDWLAAEAEIDALARGIV